MKEAKTILGITVLLSLSCLITAQDPEVELLHGMRTIMDQIGRLTKQIGDLQTEVKVIKESKKTVEENVGQLVNKLPLIEAQVNKCSTRDQVDDFKSTFIAVQEMVMDASQKCFTNQGMFTFLDILETDECAELTHNCSALATCSDSLLHYKCSCNPGYSGDGFTCQDINECIEEPTICHDSQLCVNHPGNYSCTCPAGFQMEGNICQDINECIEEPKMCGHNQLCINYPGKYSCICHAGFQKEGNTCQDINECIEEPNMCGDKQICVNHPGNYSCTCHAGFQMRGNTCQDINECRSAGNRCHRHSTCHNNIGSYTCTCNTNYDGNGYTCTESKCASPSKVISDLGCVIPVPTKMTWDEAQQNCVRRRGRLLEGLRRDHFEPLTHHFLEYLGSSYVHIGLRGGVYVNSRAPVPSEDNLWGGSNPNGSDQSKDDCGQVYLHSNTTYLLDYTCTNREPSMCQMLY